MCVLYASVRVFTFVCVFVCVCVCVLRGGCVLARAQGPPLVRLLQNELSRPICGPPSSEPQMPTPPPPPSPPLPPTGGPVGMTMDQTSVSQQPSAVAHSHGVGEAKGAQSTT